MISAAVHTACISGDIKALKSLRPAIKNLDKALDTACEFGQTRAVKWLVEQGADVHRYTALGKACKFGYLNLVKCLYKCGARNDVFAIQLAGGCGQLQIVKWVYNREKVNIPYYLALDNKIMDWILRVQPYGDYALHTSSRRKRLLQLASFL